MREHYLCIEWHDGHSSRLHVKSGSIIDAKKARDTARAMAGSLMRDIWIETVDA